MQIATKMHTNKKEVVKKKKKKKETYTFLICVDTDENLEGRSSPRGSLRYIQITSISYIASYVFSLRIGHLYSLQ